MKVLNDGFGNFEDDVIGDLCFEALDLYFDRVRADRQGGDLVVAVGVSLRTAFE